MLYIVLRSPLPPLIRGVAIAGGIFRGINVYQMRKSYKKNLGSVALRLPTFDLPSLRVALPDRSQHTTHWEKPFTMANEKHLNLLRQGVATWNRWRQENPEILPDLSWASLIGSNLEHANLAEADLYGADFLGSHLNCVDFSWANLYRANLYKTQLVATNFSGANLMQASLAAADASFANFDRANLCRADLYRVNLSGTNLRGAVLRETTMPDGSFHPSRDVWQESLRLRVDSLQTNVLPIG